MAKRKGRAARKQQREKAATAKDHGLPAPELAPKPQKTRKVGGDTVRAAVASEKAGRSGPVRRLRPPPAPGVPVLAKVFIGAAVVLAVVYGLSQFRKSGGISDAPPPTAPSQESERSVGDRSSLAPAPDTEQEETRAADEVEQPIGADEKTTAAPAEIEHGALRDAPSISSREAVPAEGSARPPAPQVSSIGSRAPAPVPSTARPLAPAVARTGPAAPPAPVPSTARPPASAVASTGPAAPATAPLVPAAPPALGH